MSTKPKIFTYTAYRKPTLDEIIEIDSCKLPANEVLNGFIYTLVGKGVLSDKSQQEIVESITMLATKYPKNKEYQKALAEAKALKPKFRALSESIIRKPIKESGRPLIKRLLKENFNRLAKKKRTLNESVVSNKCIINVDIQPEYQSAITFNINKWVNFLNTSYESNIIVFLFNGEDTLGMVSEGDYRMWLMELGVDEEVIDNAIFYDKGYAFFRYCMDSGIDEQNIADLVRFMVRHDINDSRMIDANMWETYMSETHHDQTEVRELLESAGDMISIPDLMDFLKHYNNIVLTGGGVNECLKEVEIALLALNKPFNILAQFTY